MISIMPGNSRPVKSALPLRRVLYKYTVSWHDGQALCPNDLQRIAKPWLALTKALRLNRDPI